MYGAEGGTQRRGSREKKKTGGISFPMDLATTAERSGEVERRPNKKRGHKSLGGGQGGGGGLLGSSCEGVLLDLDDCLQKSLDASRQTPLPFKHSGASSFTPAAAVRQKKGANMFLMSSSCMYRAALPGPSEPARAPRWPTRCHVWERTSVG